MAAKHRTQEYLQDDLLCGVVADLEVYMLHGTLELERQNKNRGAYY